jgi:hypothetical protein
MSGEGGSGSRDPHGMVQEAEVLVRELASDGVTARLLGGVGIALRCPSALPPSPLGRAYSDFDIVVAKDARRELPAALERLQFKGAERFNAMNGHERQLYSNRTGIELDVFIDRFKMCHELDLRKRLLIDRHTLALADLVLSKLQVAALTEKDVRDYAAITLDHALTTDDSGINTTRLTAVTGSDWGWWRTVTDNLEKVAEHLPELALPPEPLQRVLHTTEALLTMIAESPKSLRWRARAKVGDRVSWREEPEEKPGH